MLQYDLNLAWTSIRRNPILTALMVAAIGIGVGACMTTLTVYHVASKNPFSAKSSQLFHLQLDNFQVGPDFEAGGPPPSNQISFQDANNLLDDREAGRQAASYKTGFIVQSANEDLPPFRAVARATSPDFFAMFDVPFLYGGVWQPPAQGAEAPMVTVLSKATNDTLFGGEDSVGREVRLGEKIFQVAGVIDEWNPAPKFYDLTNGSWHDAEELFVPFSLTRSQEFDRWGNNSCGGGGPTNTFEEYLASECVWITFWAELPDEPAEEQYRDYLSRYIENQKALGRYERPANFQLLDIAGWLEENQVADDEMRVLVWLSVLFLLVCLLNTVGLILAKFMSQSPQIALRRALGATRGVLLRHHLVEVGLVGALGGLLGLALAFLGLWGVRLLMGSDDVYRFSMDWTMISVAIALAIAASIGAGLYPALRIGRLAPAQHLKTQ